MHLQRLYILLEILDLLRSRDGNDQWILSQQPGQAELTWCAFFAFGDVLDGFDRSQVFREILRVQGKRMIRNVSGRNVAGCRDPALLELTSSEKRGLILRKSPSSKSVGFVYLPVNIPRPAKPGLIRTMHSKGDVRRAYLMDCKRPAQLLILDKRRASRIARLPRRTGCIPVEQRRRGGPCRLVGAYLLIPRKDRCT